MFFHFLLKALTEYKAELRDDPIISTHLTKLYDNLLEQNLIRVIEPFSRVQVTQIQPRCPRIPIRHIKFHLKTQKNYSSKVHGDQIKSISILRKHIVLVVYLSAGMCLSLFPLTDGTHFLPHQTLQGKTKLIFLCVPF